jgi:hypothetical protein
MRLFVFRCKSDPDVVAATTEADGANLPVELAPWLPVDDPAVQAGESLEKFRRGANDLLGGIGQDGFYCARIEVTMLPVGLPSM